MLCRKSLSRLYSTAAENAKIIDQEGPQLPQKLRDVFLKLEQVDKNRFRSEHLLKGRRSIEYVYGGQVFTHALKAASSTTGDKLPHSVHSYFLKAGSVYEPIDYIVENIRDGKSFSTRSVKAMQNNELLFIQNSSFHVNEESEMNHEPKMVMPPGPEGLETARKLMRKRLKEKPKDISVAGQLFLSYKLSEFPPTFHRLFEARPVNPDVYRFEVTDVAHRPEFTMWVKPILPVGNDPLLNLLMAAYVSDSSMVETALLAHLARGYGFSMVFSLDHNVWFHITKFSMDEWMLLEQKSDFAGCNRTSTRARLFTKDGHLVMSAVQEGVARGKKIL